MATRDTEGCAPASPNTCQSCRARRVRRRIASWNGRVALVGLRGCLTAPLGRLATRPSGGAHSFRSEGRRNHAHRTGDRRRSEDHLSYLTASGAGINAAKAGWDLVKDRGAGALLMRTVPTTALVFTFFQIFPHYPVGISEVHLILGSTLFLLFGAAPAAFGLALGLLVQGLFFAPFDLPQYGMNVTTLLVPLFALQFVAKRIIAPETPYVQLKYRQALALSTTYQAGIVTWGGILGALRRGFRGTDGPGHRHLRRRIHAGDRDRATCRSGGARRGEGSAPGSRTARCSSGVCSAQPERIRGAPIWTSREH